MPRNFQKKINKMNVLKIILIISLAWSRTFGSKLNVPRVLLPLFADFSTNFTLEVTEGGCYTWRSLRPNTIRLDCIDADPDYNCCSRIVVSPGIKELGRHTETVLGEDAHSGLVLRCEVILDVISRLEIATTTREIFLDESPEAFEVRAYDDQGNIFSTLEGVEFEWTFRTLGDANKTGESTVVRYITFAESPYETPKAIEPFERAGLKGHIVLLEGRQTGAAAVSVRLPQSEYKDVPSVGVQLLVLTNLVITPPEATILEGDDLKYHLQRFQHGRVIEIGFPSPQYHLKSEHNIVEVDKDTGVAQGLALGRAKIVLVDGNVGSKSEIKPPTASLVVAEPHEMSLAVLPHRKWSVVIGDSYDIVAELRDRDRKLFHLGSAAAFEITLNENFFTVKYRPKNGSFVHGTPSKVGKVKVTAEFLGVTSPVGVIQRRPRLSATAELNIYRPIKVTPSLVLVPWDPMSRGKYEIPLNAQGGDGTYSWSSAQSSIAVVNQLGIVKILEKGATTVSAAMTSNPAIRGLSRFRVLPPVALEILDTAMEAIVQEPIRVYIKLLADIGGDKIPFTVCDALPFTIFLSDTNFLRINMSDSDKQEDACATIYIIGKAPGTSQLTISYGNLSASVVIAAHPRLVALNPSSGTTVLAVGTSRLVVFTGGPRSWASKPSENHHHLKTSDISEENLHLVEDRITKYTYAYRVTCRQLSKTILTLEVTNKVFGSAGKPAEASATIEVVCGKPKHLLLRPLEIRKSCPTHLEEIYVLRETDVMFEVIVKDAQGRQFDNATSLEFAWTASGIAQTTAGVSLLTTVEEGFTFPSKHIKTLFTGDRTGVAEVHAQVVGYDQEVLFAEEITAEHPPFPEMSTSGRLETPQISFSAILKVVDAMQVTPNKSDMFVGGADLRTISISNGSGHFQVASNATGIVSHKVKGSAIELQAVSPGNALLSIRDVCLDAEPASLIVQVHRIGGVAIDAPEYLEKGTSAVARVFLYDESGGVLTNFPNPSALGLDPVVGSDVLSVDTESAAVAAEFRVYGERIGATSLAVTVAGGIVSPTVHITVFAPLRIYPRNVTLLAGASVQLTVLDGPPEAHIEWSVSDAGSAYVTQDGVVSGLNIGSTRLTARALTIRKFNGQRVVSSKDTIDVLVVPLKGVQIYSPVIRLVSGGRMPVWAVSPGSTTPLSLSATPSPRFSWGLLQDSLAEIRSVFHTLGMYVPETDQAAMQLHAIKPGLATITLVVRVPGSVVGVSHSVEFTDTLRIEIVSDIGLTNPKPMKLEHLLLSTLATTELRNTRDIRENQVTILKGGPDIVRVSPDGTLTTGTSVGSAVVALGPVDRPWRHLVVHVRPVTYVMVNVVPHWRFKSSEKIQVLPNGLDLEIATSFHDDEGNEFDAVRSNLLVEADKKGFVTSARGFENKTINFNIVDTGFVAVRVWDAGPSHHPSDFIHIRSGEVLFPAQARVSVGDVICLRMPIVTSDDSGPLWAVDNPRKLQLWSDIGVAVAMAESGVAVVSHRASSRWRSRIEIAPLHKIELLPHNVVLTTKPGYIADYPVLLVAAGENDKKSNLLAYNGSCDHTVPRDFAPNSFPFKCKINFNNPAAAVNIKELFTTIPTFNIETGIYSCRVEMIGKQSPISATLSESIVLTALTVDGSVQSRSALLPFTPSVFLHQTELKVSRMKQSATFVVSGLREVLNQLTVSTDSHLVKVIKASSSETSNTYTVSVDTTWWTLDEAPSLTVALWSSSTKQRLQLRVRCTGVRIDSEESGSWLPWAITVLVVLVTLLFVASRKASNRSAMVTTASPFLQSPQAPPDVTLLSHRHSPTQSSPDTSPLRRSLNDYPVYGSPWRRRLN